MNAMALMVDVAVFPPSPTPPRRHEPIRDRRPRPSRFRRLLRELWTAPAGLDYLPRFQRYPR